MEDKDMFYSSLEYKVQLILESVDGVKPSIQTMELQWFSICPTGEVCVLQVTMQCVITMQHRPVAVRPGKFRIDTRQKKTLTIL